jgi:hypothetical protein
MLNDVTLRSLAVGSMVPAIGVLVCVARRCGLVGCFLLQMLLARLDLQAHAIGL